MHRIARWIYQIRPTTMLLLSLDFVLAMFRQPREIRPLARPASRPVADDDRLHRTAWCGGSDCAPHVLYQR